MEERLLKAERLAAIGETAAMVGHDLRNPLQGITAAAYTLKTQHFSTFDLEATRMIELIDNSVEYADGIINDLLDYSGEIRLEIREISSKAIAMEALSRIKMPSNITISDLTNDEPKLKADPAKIQRVFINIIENSIDAMPSGGMITICSKESNSNLELKFTDTGPGISEKVMEKLWKPLMTTKPKGLGLGLPICKRIVEAHGGSLSVESDAEHGTTFTLTLPIAPSLQEVNKA